MCRPGRGSSRDPFAGGHIGPPLRGGRGIQEATGIGAKTDLASGAGRSPPPTGATEQGGLRRGVVTQPYGCNTGGAQRRADVGIGPYGRCGKFHQPPGPAAHSGASAPRSRGRGGNRSREHPQNVQQPRTIPQSRRSRASSLCTREPWGRGMRIAASLRSSQ